MGTTSVPPLVRGWPILGSAIPMLRDPQPYLVKCYLEYGPVFRLRAAHRRFTVLAGPDANLMMTRGGSQRLTNNRSFGTMARELRSRSMLVALDGARHKHMRRLLRPGYSREAAERNMPLLAESVEKLLRELPIGQAIPVRSIMQRLISEEVGLAALGRGAGDLMDDLVRFSNTLIATSLGMQGRWHFLRPGYRRAQKRLEARALEVVAERRAKPRSKAEGADLADIFTHGRDPEGKPFEDGDLIYGVLGGFVAGIDTAASVASFLTWELYRQPELLERVTAEVDATFAAGIPTAQGLRQMRLLRGALLETLRLHSINISLSRHVAEPFEFAGFSFAPGEPVLVAATVSHFLPDLFPDPQRFDVERYFDPRNEDRQPGAYAPYGLGHHVCLGAGQAEILMMMAVSVLLRTVRAELHPAGYQVRGEMSPLPAVERACRLRIVEARHTIGPHPARAAQAQVAMVLPTLDRRLLAEVAARVVTRTYPPGATIVRQGDPSDRFYMILRGEVEVLATEGDELRPLNRLGAGSYFGETGLLTGAPRNASVRALDETTVLELDRDGFREMLEECDLTSQELARVMRERVVATQLTAALPSLDAANAALLAPQIERRIFAAGEVIVRKGDPAHHFYILVRGSCDVTSLSHAGKEIVLGELVAGDFFGEVGLLQGVPRMATVRARDEVETLELGREGFRALIEDTHLAHEEIARAMRRRLGSIDPEDQIR